MRLLLKLKKNTPLLGNLGSKMKINNYTFGQIEVEGTDFSNDVIIFPEKVMPNWWREEGHKVHLEDLEAVIKRKPEVLIIGTGAQERMRVSEKVKQELKKRGIGKVMALNTKRACEKFNELMQSEKEAVAALHLTC